eukprot:CAMPEP_0119410756 /NCGR_PEP_ID=MMETSP1335-20130426/3685_1 /TAXON_ID=259385 /ORGANISM="Chrysoculter rhomboideus, Strain RCC1486" /LENGTH=114 /DNA_ID=CAMNT_0007435333 /DNA_START=46 /DNA_END=390 /DNA_ORIENTATION=-
MSRCSILLALAALLASTQAFQAPTAFVRTTRTSALRPALVMDDSKPVESKSGLGRTVDQDGKSNVWAIEPRMKVEQSEFSVTDPKVLVGIAALVGTLVAIPLFPTLFNAANSQY